MTSLLHFYSWYIPCNISVIKVSRSFNIIMMSLWYYCDIYSKYYCNIESFYWYSNNLMFHVTWEGLWFCLRSQNCFLVIFFRIFNVIVSHCLSHFEFRWPFFLNPGNMNSVSTKCCWILEDFACFISIGLLRQKYIHHDSGGNSVTILS